MYGFRCLSQFRARRPVQSLRLLSLLEFSRWLPEHLLAVSLESPEPAGQVTVLQETSAASCFLLVAVLLVDASSMFI